MVQEDKYNQLRSALLAKGWSENLFNRIIRMDSHDEKALKISNYNYEYMAENNLMNVFQDACENLNITWTRHDNI